MNAVNESVPLQAQQKRFSFLRKYSDIEKEQGPPRFTEVFRGGVISNEGEGVHLRSRMLDALLGKRQEAQLFSLIEKNSYATARHSEATKIVVQPAIEPEESEEEPLLTEE